MITAGFIDQVAVRKDRVIQTSSTGVQFATPEGVAYKALGIEEDVFIHPSSVLASASPPEYVIFHEVVRTSRVWLKGIDLLIIHQSQSSHTSYKISQLLTQRGYQILANHPFVHFQSL